MKNLILLLVSLAYCSTACAQSEWRKFTPMNYSRTSSVKQDTKGRLYASGGLYLYRSADGGLTWERLKSNSTGISIGKSDTLFRIYASTLQYSTDSADHWASRGSITGGLNVHPSGAMFANAGNNLKRSLDGGLTWVEIKPDLNGLVGADFFEIDKTGKLLAAKNSRFYTSTDLGDTWIGQKPPLEIGGKFTQCLVTKDNSYLLLSTDTAILSTNGGATWSNFEPLITTDGERWINLRADSQGGIIGRLGKWMYRSQNGASAAVMEGDPQSVTRDGRIWLKRSQGQLGYPSEDGTTFINRTEGMEDLNLFRIGHMTNGEFYMVFERDLHITSADLKLFKIITPPDSFGNFVFLQNGIDSSFYAYTSISDKQTILRSTSFGKSWEIIHQAYTGGNIVFAGIDSNNWIYTGHERSTDRGATWEPFSLPGTYADAMSFGPEGRISCALSGALKLSTDGGASWTTSTYSAGSGASFGHFIVGNHIYVRDIDTLFFTTDFGLTWQKAAPPGTVWAIKLAKDESNRVFIGTGYGDVLEFDPGLKGFTHIAHTPDSAGVNDLFVHDGRIIIETSRGLYERPVPAKLNVNTQSEAPTSSARYSDGSLSFQSALHGPLEILDITGRSVKTIVMTDPVRSIFIGDLPTGIYFARCAETVAKFAVMK